MLLLLLNHFTGILFQITGTAAYHCGTAISILYFVTLFLYTVMFFPVLNTKSEIRERIMYFVTYLLPVAFMFLQFVFPALPFFSMALTLSLVGITLTQEYQLRKLLVDALNTAEHANRAKTAFLNNMSHDIRTPMNAIIGFTALAAAHVNQPDQVQEYLNKISTSGQHLLSLINDVLDMSRIESGRVKIEEKEVHLPDVMHDLRTIVNASIVSKNIEFFIDAVDVKNEDILCDKLRLNQEIAMELLSNAGFSVSLADDGDVAVETLRTAAPAQFDLVLMDIQMPKLDGYSATRQIRTLDGAIANIPIIAMTANAFEEDKQKAFAAGMNAHIAKPIEVDSLLSTIAKVLG